MRQETITAARSTGPSSSGLTPFSEAALTDPVRFSCSSWMTAEGVAGDYQQLQMFFHATVGLNILLNALFFFDLVRLTRARGI